jgi:putative membrane protein
MADEHSRNDPATVDPRFQLANERTLLAWLRTTLGLLAGAVASASPVIDLPEATRAVLGLLLLCAAAVTAFVGWRRYQAVDAAMTSGQPLPDGRSVRWVGAAVGVSVVAVGVAIIAETLL